MGLLYALVKAAELVDQVLLRPLASVIDAVVTGVYYFLWVSYLVGYCLVEGSRKGWNLLRCTVSDIHQGICSLGLITLDVTDYFYAGTKGGLKNAWDFGQCIVRFICNLLIDLGDAILWMLMLLPRAILFLWDCLLDFVVHSIVARGLSLLNSVFRLSIGLALLLILYMFRRYVYLLLIYLFQRARLEISTKTQSVYLWTDHHIQRFRQNLWNDSENAGSASRESCVVCMTQSRNVVVMPCRHLCLCKECSQQLLLLLDDRCPVCRRNITSFLLVYV
ncbi:uncharacterized protein LOC6530326 [Drosophila yakuba]|uniref:RING-type domain-containing protein n=1 Tax=Drosophila yakuba TaxID=7245 RepID=B4P6L3_DROYA|nr:uncharacterized protein LOC6530326 [Drosophila yakuba]EDW90965.1 uncharacterized protein Dyak_GE12341 [Drosophila yakuba]